MINTGKTQGNFTLAGKVFLSSDPRADLSQSDREACGRDTHTSPWHRSTHLFRGQRPSAFHWCDLCSSTGSKVVFKVEIAIEPSVFEKKTSERVQRFLSSSFPLSAPNSRPPLCSDSHSRCRSMSEHLLGRLDHSLLRTGCGPNTVSREHMVDRTGGDSDDDLLDVNQDAYAIALTLAHQMQPQQVVQGPIVMREEPLEWYVNPTSKTWCCWSRASLLE